MVQVLSPMAFRALEFSDRLVYTREIGSERRFIPSLLACFIVLLHLFIVSVCVCTWGGVGERAGKGGRV